MAGTPITVEVLRNVQRKLSAKKTSLYKSWVGHPKELHFQREVELCNNSLHLLNLIIEEVESSNTNQSEVK